MRKLPTIAISINDDLSRRLKLLASGQEFPAAGAATIATEILARATAALETIYEEEMLRDFRRDARDTIWPGHRRAK
jgi:hypothetical protein